MNLITILRALAFVALGIGILLECLGFKALSEGIVIAFGLVIMGEIRSGNNRVIDKLGDKLDKIITLLEKRK